LWIHPEKALEAKISYKILSYGMLTGNSFANNHKLSDYFHGSTTDYLHARRMVNGMSGARLIARYARTLEAILQTSMRGPGSASAAMMGL
jgi:hypothetical protein